MHSDEIPALLRQAQARGLTPQAGDLLDRHREALQHPLNWQREAGRALAAEGLATDVFTREIERWIDRERGALRGRLLELLR